MVSPSIGFMNTAIPLTAFILAMAHVQISDGPYELVNWVLDRSCKSWISLWSANSRLPTLIPAKQLVNQVNVMKMLPQMLESAGDMHILAILTFIKVVWGFCRWTKSLGYRSLISAINWISCSLLMSITNPNSFSVSHFSSEFRNIPGT